MQTKSVWTVVAVCLALVAQGVSYEGVYKGGGMLRESQIVLLSTGKALMGDSPMAMMVGKWSEAEIATNKCVVLRLVGAVQGLKQVQSGSIAARIEDGKLSVVAMATGDADITEEAAKALSSQQDPLGEYTLMPNGLDGTKRQVYERLVKQAARQVSLVRRPERLEKMMAPANWPYLPGKQTITRSKACVLNRLAQLLAGNGAADINYRGLSPTDLERQVAEAIGIAKEV